jgi:hypothetical protein
MSRDPSKSYLADDLDFHHCSRIEALITCSNCLQEVAPILEKFGWPNDHLDRAVDLIAEQLQEPSSQGQGPIALSEDWSESPNGYFGLCPTCGQTDGYLNINRDHYFVCHEHKLRWLVGSNLFSTWRDEEPEVWQQNKALLSGYREIEPH